MKDLNRFVRYGSLNLHKQKHYNKTNSFHNPPCKYGFYAMPLLYQELFLIGSINQTQKDVFGKSKREKYIEQYPEIKNLPLIKTPIYNGNDIIDYTFETNWKGYEHHKKELKKIDRKYKEKHIQIFHKFDLSDDFEIWHHHIDLVPRNEILSISKCWCLTTISSYKKALMKLYATEKTELLNGGFRYSRDHYEVFISNKI